MRFRVIDANSCGAVETSDLDLAKTDATEKDAILQNLFHYGLLVFRGQSLREGEAMAFTLHMTRGKPLMTFETTPMCARAKDLSKPAHLPGFPSIRPIGNTKDAHGEPSALFCRTGYEWHKDGDGEGITMIVCVKTPNSGGNTLFSSAYAHYDALSGPLKKIAESTIIVTSNRYTAGGPSAVDCENGLRMDATGTRLVSTAHTRTTWWKLAESRWPLVRVHPETGRKYVSTGAKNLDHLVVDDVPLGPGASRELLSEILLRGLRPTGLAPLDEDGLPVGLTAFDPDLVLEHRWRRGDVVLWDNRACLHSTTPVIYYADEERLHYHLIQARIQQAESPPRGPT